MNIVVIVMARDEESRIGKFCEAYSEAQLILVSDGGSIDRTKEIARQYPNVLVRDFTERQKMKNGYWRNPQHKHINFLIDWAHEYNPDWIIFDDCDCRPNYLLKRDYRKLLAETTLDYVAVPRLYVWGTTQHFPNMVKPGKGHIKYEASLWAWRGSVDFRSVEAPPASEWAVNGVHKTDIREMITFQEFMPPYCLIHYSWDDEEKVARKVKEYRESGLIPNMLHPLDFAGHLEPLPEFAHD